MRKLVGVMPLWDDEKNSIWMLPEYLEGLHSVNLDTMILPLTENENELKRLLDLCDGILLTGGHDVNPALYGERPLNDSVVWNDTRDRMETYAIHYALERDMGVLGICRGIQVLNTVLGGSLYQDLPMQHPTGTEHHMKAPYDRAQHRVKIIRGTPLYDLIGKKEIWVNSIHHQAVKDKAPGLQTMAVSEDCLTEAVWIPDRRFVWGIQWHPEYWFRTNADCWRIFHCFAEKL